MPKFAFVADVIANVEVVGAHRASTRAAASGCWRESVGGTPFVGEIRSFCFLSFFSSFSFAL